MNIIVTPHVKKRFRERFRLQFNPDIFKEGRDTIMLKKLFREARSVDFALMMRAGHYNALCAKHGRRVRVSKVRNIVFVHSDDPDPVLLTVLREGCIIGGIKY